MFSIEQRNRIQEKLVDMAAADESIIGAAVVGSSATDQQDAWSDIDLMLQLAGDSNEADVIERWTARLYAEYSVAHHLNVIAGNGAQYRVFLTTDSLQLDISFWPSDEFRARGDRFKLLFGDPNPAETPAGVSVDELIGQAWLFAIHIRSALAREQSWFALSLMDTMRDRIVMLASIRCGLNPHQCREVDLLPAEFLAALTDMRATSLEPEELARAFARMMDVFQDEITAHDSELSDRLAPPLTAMVTAKSE